MRHCGGIAERFGPAGQAVNVIPCNVPVVVGNGTPVKHAPGNAQVGAPPLDEPPLLLADEELPLLDDPPLLLEEEELPLPPLVPLQT
jgi:hypothetical protein